MDANSAAVRHAEQTLGETFKRHVTLIRAEAGQWLNGPACPHETECIVYSTSLLDRRDDPSVLRILRGAFSLLRRDGVLIVGSHARSAAPGEDALRDWSLGWKPHYRDEETWRGLLVRTPFGADDVIFHHEPLRANLVLTVRRKP
jgi:hypothetical protein